MAVDDLKVQFHLTPRGWVAGARSFFGKVEEEPKPRPADALATFELHIKQASGWSREERSWREAWRAPGASSEAVQQALAMYPQPDEDSDVLPA